ncbi:MAG: LPS assembly protein LptD [Methylobacter sp.]|nr:LPS assembly protein LptD [Methylobacter sp.]
MRRRLFLFFLPSLYANISFASDASWNCAQDKDTKEWVCVGEKKAANKTSETKVPVITESVKKAQPEPTEPVENAQPVVAEPVHIHPAILPSKQVIETVESSQPVTTKTVPDTHPVSTETDKDITQVSAESDKRVPPAPARASSKKLSHSETNIPGWTCDAKEADKNWDCHLIGSTDPKGQTHVVKSEETGGGLLNPAFDSKEEGTFSVLKSQLKYDPWQNCESSIEAKSTYVSGKDLREVSPLDINSDYAEIFDNEIYSYFGNVEMTRADQHSLSSAAQYDTVSETLDLQGDVYYSDDELALHSESAALKLSSNQAKLRNNLFIAPSTPLRGRAKTIYRDSKTFSRYKDVAYTSCRPGNQDWVVHASELKMDKIDGKGSAKNAWVEFKGTPVFYSPYLSFPIDNRRLSGFLAPAFGNTQKSGFHLSVPYYWNIAPNYDATLKPRYLSKRGVILGGTVRYLTEMFNGKSSLEYMPNDSLLNKSRYLAGIKNVSQFTPHISSRLDLNYVSDKDYFSDLGNALSMPTYSYLKSQADIGYRNEGVSLTGMVDNYQSIDKSLSGASIPYRRLPQIKLDLNHAFKSMPLKTALDGEFVDFQHDSFKNADNINQSLVNATRMNVKPYVSFPMQTASAFLTPKVSLQHTQYSITTPGLGLQNNVIVNSTGQLTSQIYSSDQYRTLPIVSADSGLFMERNLDFSGRSFLHTLEPRLFYLYIPKVNQNNIAIFDSALTDFSFNSMFLENRFSGTDRVQDANQLTAAITSRLVNAKTGRERLKLSVGEIAYFRNREVTLPGYPVETNQFSPLVAELNAALTDHVSVDSGVQWDPHLNEVVRYNGTFHFINQPGEIVNLGYRYRKTTVLPIALEGSRAFDIIQSDVSAKWPVYNNWSVVGEWRYSLLNNSTQDGFFGVEKENCCWRFRVIGRRWVNNTQVNPQGQLIDAVGTSQTGVFVQIELKGLTGIGDNLDDFFQQHIYGYRKPQNW